MSVIHRLEDATSAKSKKIIRAAYRAARVIVRLFAPHLPTNTLVTLVQQAALEEATSQARRVNPSGEVSLSQLALISGLDTRTIKRLQSHPPPLTELDICAEAAILAHWERDPSLRDRLTGKPIELPIYGSTGTFQGLVTHYCGRGVSPMLVAERLQTAGNVKIRNRNWVTFLHADWRWIEKEDEEFVDTASKALQNLSNTLHHNAKQSSDNHKWVERRIFSHPISEQCREQAVSAINQLLLKQKDEMHGLLSRLEQFTPSTSAAEKSDIVGAGYYVLHEKKSD